MATRQRKESFKVTAAGNVGERDIEIVVKATSHADALTEAAKIVESLAKRKDVRVYTRSLAWTRVA